MEKKINIAELLKDCPKGMELDCVLFDDVVFDEVVDDEDLDCPILIRTKEGETWNLTKEGCWDDSPSAKCVIFPKGKTTWEGFVPPCKFKDGDVVFSGFDLISIYKKQIGGKFGRLHSHVSLRNSCILEVDKDNWTLENIRLATEEEKEKLFKAIKDNGYKWNKETKTLEKLIEPKFKVGDKVRHKNNHGVVFTITSIEEDSYVCGAKAAFWFDDQDDYELVPDKFDITTLKPFDKVLVKDNVTKRWLPNLFACLRSDDDYPYMVIGGVYWRCCIPYEGNEHLLGKADDCDEYYKTWE